jgi:phosphoribosylformimino-5-aminoimidazole carboxamide ribonucleotide (ProFAR) isomerase
VLADFIAKGAKWVHLVDLDSAFNTGSNAGLFKDLIGKSSINIQLSGGIIDESSLNIALATKAVRINISTAALQNIDWVVRVINSHKDRLTIGLDISNGVLVARGSGEVIGDPFEYIKVLDRAGCMRYVVTDNSTDGELIGPNLDLLDKVSKSTKSLIIASGGVSKLSDLDNLRQMGLDGVIVGKALYVGAIDISLAIKTCYQ